MMNAHTVAASTSAVLCAVLIGLSPGASPRTSARGPAPDVLTSIGPQLDASDFWLAPADAPGDSPLARAVEQLETGRAAEAMPAFVQATSDAVLGGYARLYQGRAELALGQGDAAAASARRVIGTSPGGALGEAALWLLADSAALASRWSDERDALQSLIDTATVDLPRALYRLGVAAERLKDLSTARAAYSRVHYEFPLSDPAPDAAEALARFKETPTAATLARDQARAQLLFDGRRWADARKAFQALRPQTTGDARLLVDLRLAQCDYRLSRHAAARDGLRSLLERSWARRVDVDYTYLSALRGLRSADYLTRVSAFVKANPTNPLAEQALDELGTYHILADDDARAAEVFTEAYAKFPQGTYAERAAWKAGWWAYRQKNYRETIRIFESAAAGLLRADTRPSWMYWAARAHEQLGERDQALVGYRQTVVAYRNSYYGREAARRMAALPAASTGAAKAALAAAAKPAPLTFVGGTRPENTRLIQRLLSVGLYDDAVVELRRVQREKGSAPLLEATVAYALNRKGQLRPAITAMRRAYPQFLAEGGEAMPAPILRVIFPIQHWDLLRRYATRHELDPYLLAAQVAQESTFQADVRSPANAWGLMQILPSTGRRYAQKMGMRGFSTGSLTDPETNVQIGTQYFKELVAMLGGVAPALAAYNAGEHRVVRWQADRPGLERDEFVDDIPFPETQFYVKRILGTAEDYRALYGQTARQAARAN